MKNVRVVFKPDGIEVDIPAGSKIISAIEKSGIPFDLPCGGKGICGKCRVKVLEGASSPNETEKKILGEKVKLGWRLACQSRLKHNSTIFLEKSPSSYHKILTSKILCGIPRNPQIRKNLITLEKITLENPVSFQEHIAKHLGLEVEKIRPFILKELVKHNSTQQTVVFHNGDPIAVENGDTARHCYGIGFDLGTTTMVLTVFDLLEGKEVISIVKPNPQIKFGGDVISRIDFTLKNDGLTVLHRIVIEEINKMIDDAVKISGIKHQHLYQFVLSGNTVMEQIFLNLPLDSLSKIPFNPLMKGPVEMSANRAGIHINPEGIVFVFPVLGGFVGGDTTGLILATGIHKSDEINLAIDIGTNGEMVIGNKNSIIAASTAAGPAFEGGRISCGMRAHTGALEKCWYENGKLHWQTIGGNNPKGICGSGLIDLIAVLKHNDIIDETGRFQTNSHSSFSSNLKERDNGLVFVLEPENNDSIYITQKDVREFQAAKAAIRSGIEILTKISGVDKKDISNIYLAGALGNFVNIENIKYLGMLPDFPSEKIILSGNTSLVSTLLFLCNSELRKEIVEISRKTKVIELSLYPEFQQIFTDSLFF